MGAVELERLQWSVILRSMWLTSLSWGGYCTSTQRTSPLELLVMCFYSPLEVYGGFLV